MRKTILLLALLAVFAFPIYLPFVEGGAPLFDAINMSCGFQPNAPWRIGCYVLDKSMFESMGNSIGFVWGDYEAYGLTLRERMCGVSDHEVERLWATYDGYVFWHLYKEKGAYSNCVKLYEE